MIPKIIHFIYGLSDDFSLKPFSFFHYISILSAKKCNGCPVYLHIRHEPRNNFWYDLSKDLVEIKNIPNIPEVFSEKRIIFNEHRCDYLRLQILSEYGGIYLDIDTICNKSFDTLLGYDCVMGIEKFNGVTNGLCNAVILSSKESQFIKHWINYFDIEFDPQDWNKMAVRIPYEISKKYPNLIHIERQDSFFRYDWHNIIDMFNGDSPSTSGDYVHHLWESKLYHPILKHISLSDIRNRECLYNNIAKKFL